MDKQYKETFDLYHKVISDNTHRLSKYGTVKGYQSITRLLQEMMDDSGIQEWKNRVGEKTANAITEQAINRGKRMHDLIESRWNNEILELDLTKPGDSHYNKICPLLDNVEPFCIETTLFSDKLELTGRADTIGLYNGKLSVIDYKTSRKPKDVKYMASYGVQVAFYAMMFADMTGDRIAQGVILNAPDDEDENLINRPQEIIFPVSNYINLAIDILKQYRRGNRKCIKL